MPYIHCSTNRDLGEEVKEKMLECFVRNITLLSGKKPESTMVEISDRSKMMFGLDQTNCMMIQVELFMQSSKEDKLAFTESVLKEIAGICGVPLARIYLTFTEHDNWGKDGRLRI